MANLTPYGPRWFRSLHYGGVHVCLWWRINPDGGLHIAREFVKERGLIADLCLDLRRTTGDLNIKTIDYTAALDEEILGKTKPTDDGETREQTFRNHGIRLRLLTHDPGQGVTRISELLGSRPDGRPYLTIDPSCVQLIQAITNAITDPHDAENVLESDRDQALRALRIGAMSRPAPKPLEKAVLKPNAAGRLVEQIRQGESRSNIAWR